jgi:hypothetical protein
MKRVQIVTLTLLAAAVVSGPVRAQVPAGEVAQQAPVVEGVEEPDSPAEDAVQGDAEAQMPAVESAPADSGEEPPAAEEPPSVEQPAAEP